MAVRRAMAMLSALDRKLVRDLWRLRGQLTAVALVIASGVAVLVMSLTALEALEETAEAYYDRYRFAEVFATAKRAPQHLAREIAGIEGVQAVETRIAKFATLDIEGFEEPVTGKLLSIPARGGPILNKLAIRRGRSVAPDAPDEAVLTEPFADAHGYGPGDTVHAIINGRLRGLTIVGIALSPEFVYAIGPGALMPDDERFGVLWMGREALEAAYDLDGAFNDVSLTLLRGANVEHVIDRVDAILEPYGGTGAYARADQTSNWFLESEIDQLGEIASILPAIFLAIAAFLTNMVLARLIATERTEIGLLKAFGYSHGEIAWHYAKLVLVMAALGIALGFVLGYRLGHYNTALYSDFFRFPFLYFDPGIGAFAIAAGVSLAAALMGAAGAVRRAVRLAPAEAMRPPAPASYRRGILARSRFARVIDQPSTMIIRHIGRYPLRAAFTGVGIAAAIAILVTTMQWLDAIDHMIETEFFTAERQDVTVGLQDTRSSIAVGEMQRLPGVLAAEGARSVAAKLHAGPITRREAVIGVPADAVLRPVRDVDGRHVTLPAEGLVLSTKLAQLLNVDAGDELTVETLEGRRPVRRVPVVATFETYLATPAYMRLDALNRMMRDRPVVNAAHLLVDERSEKALYRELKETPDVAAVTIKAAAVQEFRDTLGDTMLIFVSIFVVFAGALVFGVVYNSARIALSERGRELATLRVLGFSKLEIGYILLGELAFLAFVAMPLGALFGYGLATLISAAFDTELYRVPVVVEPSTYGQAVVIGLGAAVVSAVFVAVRINRLDLIAVLKTRE